MARKKAKKKKATMPKWKKAGYKKKPGPKKKKR